MAPRNVADEGQLNTLDVSGRSEVFGFVERETSSELCGIVMGNIAVAAIS